MSTPFTVKQTIQIGANTWKPPYHVSSLVKPLGTPGKPFSLVAARDKLESRKTIFIGQVRSTAVLADSPDWKTFESNWNSNNVAYVPSQEAITSFIESLKPYGVTVDEISMDWRTMWFSGTTQAFASVPTVVIKPSGHVATQSDSGLKLQGEPTTGQAAVGGGLIVVGSAGVTAGSAAAGGVGATTASTGLGAWVGSTTAGAAAQSALGATGTAVGEAAGVAGGWVVIVVGVGLWSLGVYLLSGSANTNSSTPTQTSAENDPAQGYQSGDGTEVYGASSDENATAIANALNGTNGLDPSNLPASPPAPPGCPAIGCPSFPGNTQTSDTSDGQQYAIVDTPPIACPPGPTGCPPGPFGCIPGFMGCSPGLPGGTTTPICPGGLG